MVLFNQIAALVLLFLCVGCDLAFGQEQEVVVSGQVSTNGGNLTELAQQLVAASQTVTEEIQSNQETFASTLQNLLQVLANYVIGLLIDNFQEGVEDPQSQSQLTIWIVSMVVDTMTDSATDQLAMLNAGAIIDVLQTEVQQIFYQEPPLEAQDLIEQLGGIILQSIGSAISSTMGLEFRSRIYVEDNNDESSELQQYTYGPIEDLGQKIIQTSEQDIMINLQQGNQTQADQILNQLLLDGQIQQVVDLFVGAIGDDEGEELLEQLLLRFYGSTENLAAPLSLVMEQVYSDYGDALTGLLAPILVISAQNTTAVPNLLRAIDVAYTSQGENIQNMFSTVIMEAIELDSCNTVGVILVGAFEIAKNNEHQGLFVQNMQKAPEVSQCLQDTLQSVCQQQPDFCT